MAVAIAPILSAFVSVGTAVGISAATSFFIGIAVLNVAAIAAVGAAIDYLKPDLPSVDSLAGQQLQTTKNNYSPVPVVYGENKLAGNIIFFETNQVISGATNKDYWAVHVVADGEINDYLAMYADETELTEVSSGIFTNDYVHIKVYTTSGGSGINLNSVSFVTSSAGATSTGSTLGLTNIFIPENVAFFTVHQKYDATNHPQLNNLIPILEGKKITTITSSSTTGTATYSQNPAEQVYDIMINYLNIPSSQIDLPSFYNAKTKCNSYGYTSNISFINQTNIQAALKAILATFRGKVAYSEGKWKLKLDEKSQSILKTLTEDDIINNSLSISMRGFSDIANKITVKYINPDDEYLSAEASIIDNDLVEYDGQEIEKTIDVLGCNNQTQAEKLAEITLNTLRYSEDEEGNRLKQSPIIASFAITVKNADIEIGDVISLEHSLFSRTRKFQILSLESDQSGIIKVGAMEYCETHFKDSSGTYLI